MYPKARLSEFFMVNVEELCTEFEKIVKGLVFSLFFCEKIQF